MSRSKIVIGLLVITAAGLAIVFYFQTTSIQKLKKSSVFDYKNQEQTILELEQALTAVNELNKKATKRSVKVDSILKNYSNAILQPIAEYIDEFRYSEFTKRGAISQLSFTESYLTRYREISPNQKRSILWVLRSEILIESYLNLAKGTVRKKWRSLSLEDQNNLIEALAVAEDYLREEKYRQGGIYIWNSKSIFRGVESFLYERISDDGIPPGNLLIVLSEIKEILSVS